MGQTTFANSRGIVHKGSGGTATVFPDVCKTPAPPAPFIPIPYPNTAPPLGTNGAAGKVKGTQKVQPKSALGLKSATYSMSTGDEAGTQFLGLSTEGAGMVIMDQLQTLGFTKRGAALMVEAKPLEDPADQVLLYAILSKPRR